LADDIFDGCNAICATAKNGRFFGKIGRSNVNRFFVMTDEVAANVSCTALSAMNNWHATPNSLERNTGTQRSTKFAGVAGCNIIRGRFFYCSDFKHGISFLSSKFRVQSFGFGNWLLNISVTS